MKKEFNKNIPNYLTISRIIVSIIVIIFLLFPFDMINVSFPKYLINGIVIIDLKLVIAAVFFVLASITDFFDGYLARKHNCVTDLGKVTDAIADKMLVNGLLIILSGQGYISPAIPVIIILRDTAVNTIKMIAGNNGDVVAAIKTGKFKTAFLMIGLTLKLFYDLPFSLIPIRLSDYLLIIAAVLGIVSGAKYYTMAKDYIIEKWDI